MYSIEHKVVWITGASSGIGEALVNELSKYQNIKLVLSSRRMKELERVSQQCNLQKENYLILELDLENTSNIRQKAEHVISKFGRIDVLINNGGISQRSKVIETPLEIDRKLFEVNYFGTVALTKAVLPYMVKQKEGRIIVISSIAGKFGYYLRSAYSATKFALVGFFEALRLEQEENNIKVTIAFPGKIKTPISLNALNAKGEANNQIEQSHEDGLPAADCAKQIIEALKKEKKEILIGGKELLAVYFKKWFPALFYWIIKRQKQE